jgi:hypothetical protein
MINICGVLSTFKLGTGTFDGNPFLVKTVGLLPLMLRKCVFFTPDYIKENLIL